MGKQSNAVLHHTQRLGFLVYNLQKMTPSEFTQNKCLVRWAIIAAVLVLIKVM